MIENVTLCSRNSWCQGHLL